MRILFLFVVIVLVISCSSSKIEIKNTEIVNEITNLSIKTTKVEIYEEIEELNPMPSLRILYPNEGQLTKNSTVIVKLGAYNFSIVPIESPVRDNQGHLHVWLDSEKKIVAEDDVAFDNVSSGKHTLVAELVKSNHSSLSPKVIESMTFNVEAPVAKKDISELTDLGSYLREYTIEADDNDFYPNKILSRIGDNVTIHFKFRDHLIYYAGLDIIGPFTDVKHKRGDEQAISRSFTMREKTIIKSFWPSSGVKKAELIVEVEK